jgi:CheY-like chemotaxis protein
MSHEHAPICAEHSNVSIRIGEELLMSTVLIVEDEEHLRATLAYNVRKAGYEVQTATTGPEAVALFHARPANLVLLDVMPYRSLI